MMEVLCNTKDDLSEGQLKKKFLRCSSAVFRQEIMDAFPLGDAAYPKHDCANILPKAKQLQVASMKFICN